MHIIQFGWNGILGIAERKINIKICFRQIYFG